MIFTIADKQILFRFDLQHNCEFHIACGDSDVVKFFINHVVSKNSDLSDFILNGLLLILKGALIMDEIEAKKELVKKIKEEVMQSTVVPCANIKLSNEECSIFDSKVGGFPYFPEGAQVPVDSEGNKLYLLAQINCGDISGLEGFPQSGMLQFFISDDDLYGSPLTIPSPQDHWRIVYYPEIDMDTDPAYAAIEFENVIEREFSPFEGEYKMSFELSSEGMSVWDFRFEDLFVERWNALCPGDKIDSLYDLDDGVFEVLWEGADHYDEGKSMHKMGGYPYFTQTDPRDSQTYDTLLFQLDSEGGESIDLMWGDLGVGNFFINKEALKNLDFSDVVYNWDCF